MIIGNAHTNKVANNTMDIVKKIYRISFPLHLKCLNLRAKSGNSDTIKTEKITVKVSRVAGCIIAKKTSFAKLFGSTSIAGKNKNPTKNMVIAGVGSPINASD